MILYMSKGDNIQSSMSLIYLFSSNIIVFTFSLISDEYHTLVLYSRMHSVTCFKSDLVDPFAKMRALRSFMVEDHSRGMVSL